MQFIKDALKIFINNSDPKFRQVTSCSLGGSSQSPDVKITGILWENSNGEMFITQRMTLGPDYSLPLMPHQFIGSGVDAQGKRYEERTDLITLYAREQVAKVGAKPHGRRYPVVGL